MTDYMDTKFDSSKFLRGTVINTTESDVIIVMPTDSRKTEIRVAMTCRDCEQLINRLTKAVERLKKNRIEMGLGEI